MGRSKSVVVVSRQNKQQAINHSIIQSYIYIPTAIFAENKDKVSIVTFVGVIKNKQDIEESLPDNVNFATK